MQVMDASINTPVQWTNRRECVVNKEACSEITCKRLIRVSGHSVHQLSCKILIIVQSFGTGHSEKITNSKITTCVNLICHLTTRIDRKFKFMFQ